MLGNFLWMYDFQPILGHIAPDFGPFGRFSTKFAQIQYKFMKRQRKLRSVPQSNFTKKALVIHTAGLVMHEAFGS